MKRILLSMAIAALGLSAYAGTVTFDFTTNTYGLPEYVSSNNGNDTKYVPNGAVITSGDVKITLDYTPQEGVTDGGWRMWNDGIRAYYKRNATFTVTTTNNQKVTQVKWTAKSELTFALKGTTTNINSWTGEEASVTFEDTASKNLSMQTITVTYGEAPTDTPDDPGSDTPDTPDTPDLSDAWTVTKALEYIAAGNEGDAMVKGIISEISEVSTQYGNATYTIKDALTDTKGLLVFRGKWLNGASFTSEDQIEVGGTVVVSGKLINYYDSKADTYTPEVSTNNVILSYTSPSGETPEIPEDTSIFSESFATSLGQFTTYGDIPEGLSYVWSFASGYGAKASAYVNTTNYAALNWLVSPVIDLTNYKNVILSFDHALNYLNNGTAANLCKVYVGEAGTPSETAWTNLSDKVTYPEGNNWTFVPSGDLSLAAFEGKKIQIGFLYNSTSDVAPTWEIKNLVVNGESSNAVEAIGIDMNAPIEYYNLQGVRVENPSNGLYIIRQGNKATKAVIR